MSKVTLFNEARKLADRLFDHAVCDDGHISLRVYSVYEKAFNRLIRRANALAFAVDDESRTGEI